MHLQKVNRTTIVPFSMILLALILLIPMSHGQTPAPSEYEIKAAFLFNFAKFIEWPANDAPSLSERKETIVLGILGDDPFGGDLDKIIRGKKIRERELIVKRFSDIQSIQKCHILFVSKSEKKNLTEILGRLKNSNTLTVSEIEQFTEIGGMINFILEDNRIRFQINLGVAEREGLRISSQLLKLAYITKENSKQ